MIAALFTTVVALAAPQLPSSDPSGTQWAYVAFGWGVTTVVLVTYVVIVILRGRALSRRVAPEDRRWM